jgi:ABC transporter DrrB family efflux protein
MTTSTSAVGRIAVGADPAPTQTGRHGASYATTATSVAKRTLLQFFRTPQVLMMGTIQGALFLFMFRYVFGGAINTRGALKYVDFLVPGFLVTAILWTGMSAASGVAEDANAGLYDRLRSLPVPRSAVIVGRSLADTALVAWAVFVTAILGFIVGFRAHGGIGAVALGFALIVLGGWALSWVFILVGLVSKSAQAAQGMSMLMVPFSFVSSANVPIKSMPGWMQPFAANQPISVIINAVRSLMQGGTARVGIEHSTAYWVVAALLWCAGITAVFLPLCARRFGRRR